MDIAVSEYEKLLQPSVDILVSCISFPVEWLYILFLAGRLDYALIGVHTVINYELIEPKL